MTSPYRITSTRRKCGLREHADEPKQFLSAPECSNRLCFTRGSGSFAWE